MINTEDKKGTLLVIISSFLSSFLPIIIILSYASISPFMSYALVNIVSALFLFVIITIKKDWKDIQGKKIFKEMFLVILLISVIYYGLVYIGIKYTTAGNSSIFLLMEIFFTFIIFSLMYKETYSIYHLIGAILMVFGAFLVLFKGTFEIKSGDLIIIFATIFPPIGNYYQQKLRKKISVYTLLFYRSIVTGIIFLILSIIIEDNNFHKIYLALPFILIIGILIMSIGKILWIESIHRISVSKAISLSTITPVFTLFFAYIIINEIPTISQIFGIIPIIIGSILITRK